MQYNILDCPGVLSEDATVVVKRLDWEQFQGVPDQVWTKGIRIWGFSGDLPIVHSIEELRAEFTKRRNCIGAYVYTYTWAPLAEHAPFLPVAIICTDNKFDAAWVCKQWELIHDICGPEQLNLPLVGHVHDGDGRLRKAGYALNRCMQPVSE